MRNLKRNTMARLKLKRKSPQVDINNNPFIARTGNERIKVAQGMKIPKMLCGELIFETSVVMLFTETNGKIPVWLSACGCTQR